MQLGKTTLNQLRLADRWNVENYLNPKPIAISTYNETINLGELFNQSKISISSLENPDKPYKFIGIKNVESVTGDLIGDLNCFGRDLKSPSQIVKNGHVLFGRIRPQKNKVFLADRLPDNVICSMEFYVLIPNLNMVTPRILKAMLSSSLVLNQVSKFVSGATIPRIAYADLASFTVPYIPIEKQIDLEQVLLVQDARRVALKTALKKIPDEMESVLTDYFRIEQKSHSIL